MRKYAIFQLWAASPHFLFCKNGYSSKNLLETVSLIPSEPGWFWLWKLERTLPIHGTGFMMTHMSPILILVWNVKPKAQALRYINANWILQSPDLVSVMLDLDSRMRATQSTYASGNNKLESDLISTRSIKKSTWEMTKFPRLFLGLKIYYSPAHR